MDLGARIRELRRVRGWSQDDLARATGDRVEQTVISRIERGATIDPGVSTVAYLARAFRITIDDLVAPADDADVDPLASASAFARFGPPSREEVEDLQKTVEEQGKTIEALRLGFSFLLWGDRKWREGPPPEAIAKILGGPG